MKRCELERPCVGELQHFSTKDHADAAIAKTRVAVFVQGESSRIIVVPL